MPRYDFWSADESQLNSLLEGRQAGLPLPWINQQSMIKLPSGTVGVVTRSEREIDSELFQPIVIVVKREDERRLFGRLAQLRSDLSPLSSWCHIIEPRRFDLLEDLSRETNFGGTEAAWIGLTVAEALLRADRSPAKLKIAACLATQTFAVARTRALWEGVGYLEVSERYTAAQRLLRPVEPRGTDLRSTLEPIWAALSAASSGELSTTSRELRPLVESLKALVHARRLNDPNEGSRFASPLKAMAPEAEVFDRLPGLSPEERLHEFDGLRKSLEQTSQAGQDHQALQMMTGYLATIAAGGAASLSLAAEISSKWPGVTAWAYVLGSLGEQAIWTSSFDGLGRLVGRELIRPLRFEDPPTCDFALDEAAYLVDPQLADPLVNLKIKQLRVVTVSLMPGVNVAVPLTDSVQEQRSSDGPSDSLREPRKADPIAALADALWPLLQARIEHELSKGPQRQKTQRGRGSSKRGVQSKFRFGSK